VRDSLQQEGPRHNLRYSVSWRNGPAPTESRAPHIVSRLEVGRYTPAGITFRPRGPCPPPSAFHQASCRPLMAFQRIFKRRREGLGRGRACSPRGPFVGRFGQAHPAPSEYRFKYEWLCRIALKYELPPQKSIVALGRTGVCRFLNREGRPVGRPWRKFKKEKVSVCSRRNRRPVKLRNRWPRQVG